MLVRLGKFQSPTEVTEATRPSRNFELGARRLKAGRTVSTKPFQAPVLVAKKALMWALSDSERWLLLTASILMPMRKLCFLYVNSVLRINFIFLTGY